MSAEHQPKISERPPTARVFFALWPPADEAARLAELARQLAAQWGGRPTRAETVHLTLAFIGEVTVAELPALCALARGIPGRSFSMRLAHFGYWPKNQLLWAGCAAVLKEQTENKYKADFTALTTAQRLELIKKIDETEEHESALIFYHKTVKNYAVQHFTGSKFFLTEHRGYAMIPGPYQGWYNFKLFTYKN